MNRNGISIERAAALIVACAGLAASASATAPLQKVIENTDPVPGVAAGPIWFIGSNGSYMGSGSSGVAIDFLGNVTFRGKMAGTGVVAGASDNPAAPNNEFGVWYGSPGSLNLVVRDSNAAPDGPAATQINRRNTATQRYNSGLTNSSANSYFSSPSGAWLSFSSNLRSTDAANAATGGGVWAGQLGNLKNIYAGGSAGGLAGGFARLAPGCLNAEWSIQGTDVPAKGYLNNAGFTTVSGSLRVGPAENGPSDVVVGTNSGGIWGGTPITGLQLILRTGDAASGTVLSTTGALYNNATSPAVNGASRIAGTMYLRQGSGSTAITNVQDGVMMTNHGGSLRVFAQEGGNVPGFAPGTVTYAGLPGSIPLGPQTPFSTGLQYFNNNGRVMYSAALSGGGVTSGVNDSGLFVFNANTESTTRVYRRGDSVAALFGLGVTIGTAGNLNDSRLNNQNHVVHPVILTGTGVSTASTATGGNNGALLLRDLNTSTTSVIVREGLDLGPALMDPAFNGVLMSDQSSVIMNNNDVVVFQTTLAGAGVTTANDRAIFTWDPWSGLSLVLREGTNIGTNGLGISSQADFVVSTFGYATDGNAEGGSLALADSHNGISYLALTATSVDPAASLKSIVLRIAIPTPGSASLLALGGLLAARRRRA